MPTCIRDLKLRHDLGQFWGYKSGHEHALLLSPLTYPERIVRHQAWSLSQLGLFTLPHLQDEMKVY